MRSAGGKPTFLINSALSSSERAAPDTDVEKKSQQVSPARR